MHERALCRAFEQRSPLLPSGIGPQRSSVAPTTWSRKLVTRVLAIVVVMLLRLPAAEASALVVPKAPEALEEMEQAFARMADRDEPELWAHAPADANAIARAWATLRDGVEGQRFGSTLMWRLDSVCGYLPEAIEHRDAHRLRKAAVVGLHLLVPLRGYYRAEGEIALRRLRVELRELVLYARSGELHRAESARGRANHLWSRLRGPVEQRARSQRHRMAQVGSYFDLCFHELAVASSERDQVRLHHAARSALDLTELARTLLESRR